MVDILGKPDEEYFCEGEYGLSYAMTYDLGTGYIIRFNMFAPNDKAHHIEITEPSDVRYDY